MDEYTYKFSKKVFLHETSKNNIPEEVKDIVKWLKGKSFTMTYLQNPQINHYNKEVYPDSYVIDFSYDLGEKKRQILKITVLKNQWTNWLIEWWFRLDEIPKDSKFEKGNDFQVLKDKIIDFIGLRNEIISKGKYIQMSFLDMKID